MTTTPIAAPTLAQRVAKLEKDLSAVQNVLANKRLASITSNPPSVEHQFAINQIIDLAKVLAKSHPEHPVTPELTNWIASIGE